MKERKFKGLTLVELVIVMAILGIIMAAIARMFLPIGTTFVNATVYEAQRTTQNGIVQYLSENLRYASVVGMVQNAPSVMGSNPGSFKNYIRDKVLDGIPVDIDSSPPCYCGIGGNHVSFGSVKVEAIVIDNRDGANPLYGGYRGADGVDYWGRLYKYPGPGGEELTIGNQGPGDHWQLCKGASQVANWNGFLDSTDGWRLALGQAYYGLQTYSIALTPKIETHPVSGKDIVSIGITVSSIESRNWSGMDASRSTTGEVLLKNISPHYVDKPGKLYTADFGNSTTKDQVTMIFFITPL